MKLITKLDVINGISDAWLEQYPLGIYLGTDKEEIYNELCKIKGNCKKEDIDKIIGNDTWTILRCSVCNSNVLSVVNIDFKLEDFEINICKCCLEKALSKINEVKK